jgi:hypothetical protein
MHNQDFLFRQEAGATHDGAGLRTGIGRFDYAMLFYRRRLNQLANG